MEAKLGKDHPQAATVLNNLALLHQQAGRHARAEVLYQRALVIKETAFFTLTGQGR